MKSLLWLRESEIVNATGIEILLVLRFTSKDVVVVVGSGDNADAPLHLYEAWVD